MTHPFFTTRAGLFSEIHLGSSSSHSRAILYMGVGQHLPCKAMRAPEPETLSSNDSNQTLRNCEIVEVWHSKQLNTTVIFHAAKVSNRNSELLEVSYHTTSNQIWEWLHNKLRLKGLGDSGELYRGCKKHLLLFSSLG